MRCDARFQSIVIEVTLKQTSIQPHINDSDRFYDVGTFRGNKSKGIRFKR